VPIGYSDHTLGIAISLAAVGMGATVIEKHFTLDRTLPGPDHHASLDLPQLHALVAGIRQIELAWGDGIKMPRPSEFPVRELVRRSAFAAHAMEAGHVLNDDDIRFLRPGKGIGPEHTNELRSRTLKRALKPGDMLAWDDLT